MTAYLVWRGMTLEAIGIWRGVSSAAGLAGTFVYPFLSSRMSLVDTGMFSIVFQFLCLSLSYSSLFIDDYNTSLAMLIGGVCASRVGLWVFDISVTQVSAMRVSYFCFPYIRFLLIMPIAIRVIRQKFSLCRNTSPRVCEGSLAASNNL
jgi:hypothetical protein